MRIYAAVAWFALLGALPAAPVQGRVQQAAAHKQGDQSQAAAPVASSANTQPAAPTKVDPAKEADIRRLLVAAGAKDLAIQTMSRMTTNIRPLMIQSLPPGDYRETLITLFFEKFQSKVNAQQFVDLMIPIYDKYLTDEDIKGLIQFYGTPLGQKTLKVLPELAADSQLAGQKWGEQMGRESMLEVLAEHPELKEALQTAARPATPQ
jgi:hypothetical protein